MKKIYLYVAFALASIGMISCTDILDQDPLDSFTDEAVWNDLALSETYLNAQYMNLMAENMKGTRFAHYTDEVFQKHTYGSENVTQGLLSCDNAGIGWDDTMWDPWYSYYQYISKYNPQIQISAESETKRSIFREKDKTKRSKKESAQHSKSRNKSFVMTSVSAL